MKITGGKNICFITVLLIIILTMPFLASAEEPFMVKDLSLDQNFSYGVEETEFANVNGVLFFKANSQYARIQGSGQACTNPINEDWRLASGQSLARNSSTFSKDKSQVCPPF